MKIPPDGRINRAQKIMFMLLAYLIPFIILLLCYLALHISPFGDHMLVFADARGMYVGELSFINRALHGLENGLYSFKYGIGMNIIAAISNMLNPANILVCLFDITTYPNMYALLLAVDIALCGLTMFLFLSGVYGWKGNNLIFSTVYAMMGFNVAYCFQYNFMLGPELLPLIVLGIHRILKGKGPWLYIITLSYAILASFYFGFMLCIASVVIFLFWYVRDWHALTVMKRKIWINYTIASLVAGLLPAVVWVAALQSLSGGRLDQTSILDFTFTENMSLADIGAKFFIGANNISEEINGKPNIFIGSLALFLNLAFFLDRRNTTRKKIVYAAPLVFYIITFYIKAFSMMVQGFSSTNWFNYRYSFVFSFLMITIACEEFATLRNMDSTDFKKTCFAFILFVILIFSQQYSYVTGGGMLLGLLLLSISLAVIWWNRVNPMRAPTGLLAILLVLLCSIESYVNYNICTGNLLEEYTEKKVDYRNDLFYGSILSESVRNSDPGFYRMENEHNTNRKASNDPMLFGYNGLSYVGSFGANFVYQGLSKLGHSWWSNRMWYWDGKPNVFDSLLGVKYVVSERDLDEEKNYEQLVQLENKYILYRNPYALPIAILAARDDTAMALGFNPFDNHNALWKSLSGGNENVFDLQSDIAFTYRGGNDGTTVNWDNAKTYRASVMASASTAEEDTTTSDEDTISSESNSTPGRDIKSIQYYSHVECTFTAEHDGPIYGYNGMAVDENYGYSGEAMYYIGTFHKGDTVTDYIPINGSVSEDLLNMLCAEYSVAYPNQEVLDKYSVLLQQRSGYLEKLTDSHLVGHFSAESDGRLFFTFPYDEGWTLTVDGIEIPLVKAADLFMAANISSGEHDYEMRFFPKGIKTGMYISCGAALLLLGLIMYTFLDRKRNRHTDTEVTTNTIDGEMLS
ncbi:MAG: YfhO family protein [Clostridia bacterium]|nr:YfhO family protein [Clostridia bacterium]